jgi:hypothetical protein
MVMERRSQDKMSRNLFFTVMEADGDELQPFDGGDPGTADAPPEDTAPPATDDAAGGLDDGPPPLNEDDGGGMDDFSMDDNSGGDDTSSDSSEGDEEQEADQKDTKLSDKANNILNERLYRQFTARNNEIEDIINNLKGLVPLLPMDVVKSNDESMAHLKSALMEGQRYVINDFVDSGYGENLLKYQQLDGLYVTLLNQIDKNLKKIKK